MEIDATGAVPLDLSGFKARMDAAFRDAFGEDLVLDSETPQGQYAGAIAAAATEIEEALSYYINGFGLYSAMGRQVDGLGSFLDIERIAGVRSSATVTFTGTVGTVIDKGTVVKTSAGAVFVLDAAVVIGAGGTVNGTVRSRSFGPVPAAAGALSVVEENISGLTSVTNAAAASLGSLDESDAEYRARYPRVLAQNGRGSTEHIRARILAVEGVVDCRVVDNTDDDPVTLQGLTLPGHSILAIVEGGINSEVAAALFAAKTGGIPTVGDVVVEVPHANDNRVRPPVRFRRVREIALAFALSITYGPEFSNRGAELIKERCAAWFTGEYMALSGRFETGGAQIGSTVDPLRLLTPVQSVPGHIVTAHSLTLLSDGSALPALPDLDVRYTLAVADITVTLTAAS